MKKTKNPHCVILSLEDGMSNHQIREIARKDPNNGEYTTIICRQCGNFWCSENGDARTAIIQDGCEECHTFPIVED